MLPPLKLQTLVGYIELILPIQQEPHHSLVFLVACCCSQEPRTRIMETIDSFLAQLAMHSLGYDQDCVAS